ncbi:hypothetical protein P153DRAFT_364102 [Dothidotthia symphoricarpi CBS 119687]|uniref:Uncharacterized protein n=1 Tax=Dothidotthia symphoricarpi CBS 119687 TaxID=1392245 RepID=A0A6A6ALM8_9PLEO|nr:uncharacterized protein P153DRAFT_364102 [Dothidotthia symphoricarpi CBS 119687]KAF2132839.1 hypothetical protein P153DRAFT_364102 [Dothidotthia symphoricarpi CBS 119687]
MPALVVDTSSTASSTGARSPDRPPVSPITPTTTAAQLAPLPRADRDHDEQARPAPPPPATFIKQPSSIAISESSNPDAIALRSAISLLQLQREKSKRDLQALEDLKAAAVSDPHSFVRSLQEQRSQVQTHTDILTPTLSDLDHEQRRKDSASMDAPPPRAAFPAIPQPQNIVRCPPVNWAKYHVVGEPLDRMHDEQRKWPGAPEPPKLQSGMRAPPHAVAAPYSPFVDGVGQGAGLPAPVSVKGVKKSPARP